MAPRSPSAPLPPESFDSAAQGRFGRYKTLIEGAAKAHRLANISPAIIALPAAPPAF